MAKRQQREFCGRWGVSVTDTDYDAGYCTNCNHELPQRPMPKVSTRLRSLLEQRMPRLVKASKEANRRAQKFQAFDVDEVMARHSRLIELAVNRGYSVKALTGLVRAAEDAWQLNHT